MCIYSKAIPEHHASFPRFLRALCFKRTVSGFIYLKLRKILNTQQLPVCIKMDFGWQNTRTKSLECGQPALRLALCCDVATICFGMVQQYNEQFAVWTEHRYTLISLLLRYKTTLQWVHIDLSTEILSLE